MGCHTYIYKKVKEIPTEEFKKDVTNAIAQIEASGKYSDKERENGKTFLNAKHFDFLISLRI